MKKFKDPGAVVFVIVPEDARQKERLEDYAAASMFVQNIMLLAWDKGIGTCWKTPGSSITLNLEKSSALNKVSVS